MSCNLVTCSGYYAKLTWFFMTAPQEYWVKAGDDGYDRGFIWTVPHLLNANDWIGIQYDDGVDFTAARITVYNCDNIAVGNVGVPWVSSYKWRKWQWTQGFGLNCNYRLVLKDQGQGQMPYYPPPGA